LVSCAPEANQVSNVMFWRGSDCSYLSRLSAVFTIVLRIHSLLFKISINGLKKIEAKNKIFKIKKYTSFYFKLSINGFKKNRNEKYEL